MTKSELIELVASKVPRLSRNDVEAILNTILDTMGDALKDLDRIEIRGFGSFVAKERKARIGRNPRTGEKVQVPKKWVPFFTVGKELRERVNEQWSGERPSVENLISLVREDDDISLEQNDGGGSMARSEENPVTQTDSAFKEWNN